MVTVLLHCFLSKYFEAQEWEAQVDTAVWERERRRSKWLHPTVIIANIWISVGGLCYHISYAQAWCLDANRQEKYSTVYEYVCKLLCHACKQPKKILIYTTIQCNMVICLGQGCCLRCVSRFYMRSYFSVSVVFIFCLPLSRFILFVPVCVCVCFFLLVCLLCVYDRYLYLIYILLGVNFGPASIGNVPFLPERRAGVQHGRRPTQEAAIIKHQSVLSAVFRCLFSRACAHSSSLLIKC